MLINRTQEMFCSYSTASVFTEIALFDERTGDLSHPSVPKYDIAASFNHAG
jgi:hypothetical protein